MGWILIAAGRPEEAVGMIEKAIRLNPRASVRYLQDLGMAYREVGRCEEAITVTKQFLAVIPNYAPAYSTLAICYAEFDRLEEARAAVAELVRLSPSMSLDWVRQNLPAKNPARLERHLAALRKAGVK
jgi:tetratricopeptide (TPR) repeat protein